MDSERNSHFSYVSPTKIMAAHLQPSPSIHGTIQPPTKIPRARAPSSTLLQDLIQKQRAERNWDSGKFEPNSRDSNSHPSEVDRNMSKSSTSESASGKSSHETQRSSQESKRIRQAGEPPSRIFSVAREMGLREQEAYLDRITKENFDLKLDIFYNRKHNASIEAKLETLEREEVNYKQRHTLLQETNARLLEELEKRDQAVQEAALMVCRLEEKVKQLELTSPSAILISQRSTLPPTANNTHTFLDTNASPLQQSTLELTSSPRSESFYSEEDEEDDTVDHASMMAPPSLLSIGSFPSVFGLVPKQRPGLRDPEPSPSPSPSPSFGGPMFEQGVLSPTVESPPPSPPPSPSPLPSPPPVLTTIADRPQPTKVLPSPREAFFNTKLPRLIGAVRRNTSIRLKKKIGGKRRSEEEDAGGGPGGLMEI